MITRSIHWMVVVGTWLMVTACMNLVGSVSSTTRYYLLESQPDEVLPSTQMEKNSSFSVGIGPITIPPYLDRPQMVTRLGDYELKADDFSQWAEPLKENISRVTVGNLSLLTGSQKIYPHPWRRSDEITFRVFIDVLQFDADGNGQVTLKSSWRIVASDGQRLLTEKLSNIHRMSPRKGTAAIVKTMSEALFGLSREIEETLAGLDRR